MTTPAEYADSFLWSLADDGTVRQIVDPAYTVSRARYAKGQAIVKPVSDGSGLKTRAVLLCGYLKGRWTHREGGYVMSRAKARRFVELYDAGYSATVGPLPGFTTTPSRLIPPRDLRREDDVLERTPVRVLGDDQHGLLSESPCDSTREIGRPLEQTSAGAANGRRDDLDHDPVLPFPLPDSPGLQVCRTRKAAPDEPFDTVSKDPRVERRRKPSVLSRLPRDVTSDVEPDHARRGKVPSGLSGVPSSRGHEAILAGCYWIRVDAETNGTIHIETSWLPDLVRKKLGPGWRRQRSGGYRQTLRSEDVNQLAVRRLLLRAATAIVDEID